MLFSHLFSLLLCFFVPSPQPDTLQVFITRKTEGSFLAFEGLLAFEGRRR